MSGDYSRRRFDPQRDFSGVLMQQGRVQLDADWNEQIELADRRLRAETIDIIGRCVVPRITPDGFRIKLSAGQLSIGPGRIYVDGLLAENHGGGPRDFDALLAELRRLDFVSYDSQPYGHNPPALPAAGTHLVYVDVWQREVTFVEEPGLVEPAVGVDTTTRLQTVWQVKVLPNDLSGLGVSCSTPDDDIPGWRELIRPSAGRLSSQVTDVPSDQGPCLLPPTAGFRRLENQLYRVEIHAGGPAGTATFKWSRDNASVVAAVTAIESLDVLTVDRTGRDAVLRFNDGDWIEITDDVREFAGRPGVMRRILHTDDQARTISLTAPLAAADGFATTADEIRARHTRIRRWDQSGVAPEGNGGVIPVPAAATAIELEDGVQVTLSAEPAGGEFRVGDFWVFCARTADGTVEELQNAPPRGVHHHYGRLGIATFPDAATDCRVLWPPEFEHGCDCTVCVTEESHSDGTLTINMALDQLPDGGGTVCLAAGTYRLGDEPLRIRGRKTVRLRGQGLQTRLLYDGARTALLIEDSRDVTVEQFSLEAGREGSALVAGLIAINCQDLTIQNCWLRIDRGNQNQGPAGIELAGAIVRARIRGNEIIAPLGVSAAASTVGLRIEQNVLHCSDRGIVLSEKCQHSGETRLTANTCHECDGGGIICLGFLTHGSLDVTDNILDAAGPGIIVGTDDARINNNQIVALKPELQGTAGVILAAGADPDGLGRCQIVGNRVVDVAGDGVEVRTRVRSLMIKQNVIAQVGGGGIVMTDSSSTDSLSIENNHVLGAGSRLRDDKQPAVGIRVRNAGQGHIVGNIIQRVRQAAGQQQNQYGIDAIAAATLHVAGNELVDIGPAESFAGITVGIFVRAPVQRVQLIDNVIRRSSQPQEDTQSNWIAIGIVGRPAINVARRDTRDEPQVLDLSPLLAAPGIVASLRVGDLDTALSPFVVFALRVAAAAVDVRGNTIDGYGAGSAVLLFGDVCTFQDNRCGLNLSEQVSANVVITGGQIVAGSNQIHGNTVTALSLRAEPRRVTVLGNITSGAIVVGNGAPPDPPLGPPWKDLNIRIV